MEVHEESISGISIDETQVDNSIFPQLKLYCLELFHLHQNPNYSKQSPAITQLLLLLRSSPSHALQPYFDYTLFPLLLLLDAAVDCRSVQKGKPVTQNVSRISDAVAEGVLQCLEELLLKCRLGSVGQMTVLLNKLAYGAMLSPSEAAEEFRDSVVRCFRTLLSNLIPCSDTSCCCQNTSSRPALLDIGDSKCLTSKHLEHYCEPNECLISFLQSEGAAAAVGHWLSLLLNIAETESSRGLRGSAKIRIDALLTLRVLVSKVGTSDALAFFLPGVITRLAKVLHVSKSMISGAAGSTEATDHAVRGLAEFLMVVLQDNANICDPHASLDRVASENESSQSFLKELRHLHVQAPNQSELSSNDRSQNATIVKEELVEKQISSGNGKLGSLHVKRTRDWLEKTSVNVDILLSKTFPHICVHTSKRIRLALLFAVQGLLSNCRYTLKRSRLMLLECLCYLVCDESKDVSMPAQDFLGFLFLSDGKYTVVDDLAEIFNRLLEKLPKLVLGCEETLALASAQQMLALMYYSGPQVVVDHLLRSPIKAAKFFDVFALCLSQESVFAGSLGKLALSSPSPTGYLHSLAELRANGRRFVGEYPVTDAKTSEVSNKQSLVKEIQYSTGHSYYDYELPRMPPWFAYVGCHKLYQALAGILRLVGLSLISDCRNEVFLSNIIDIPLDNLHKLVSEIRTMEFSRESWESWYTKAHSGRLLRQASIAVCILNEMLFGMSDQSINDFKKLFNESGARVEEGHMSYVSFLDQSFQARCHVAGVSLWKKNAVGPVRQHVIDCIGTILHEYISPEIWDFSVTHDISLLQSSGIFGSIDKHLFHDVAILHQVLIEGIGIFNLTLGANFTSSGFLCSSLYLLLENLICSNSEVRRASDAVLRLMSATSGCSSVRIILFLSMSAFMSWNADLVLNILQVGQLVMLNADYVIDSLCHQLRHLDLNPHVPNVLGAVLSCVGVAKKILPLLEEPMRSVSMELEILGRHQHPELTIPFLKAVAEIAKAAKLEACILPTQAESFLDYVKPKVSDVKKKVGEDAVRIGEQESDEPAFCDDLVVNMEDWDSILFKLNDNKRYRRIVASIAVSCLTAVTPLLASEKEPVCLISLNIIEEGIITLEKAEEAFRREQETKEGIEEVASLCSLYHLKDVLDAAEGTDENRLLPAMNKIWPYFVACVQNRIPA
ncbi:uncharacterized protein LOC130820533 isoform X3 [Amaranthus tricolor]|nr:uncharacterized protein LOC130820533 isoform X3 [Amaranthus tricolor]